MKLTSFACGAALLIGTGGMAAAQAPYPPPPPAMAPVPPPAGTLATTSKETAVDAYGNRYQKSTSTYRDANGVAQDSTTTRTTMAPPPPPPVTSSSTSTTTTTTTGPQ